MNSDFSKKLFIFMGVIFLLLMIGPYFGIHPLGAPSIPSDAIDRAKRTTNVTPVMLPDEDAMDVVPKNSVSQLSDEPDIVDDTQN